jgi:hypothetical protein
VHVGSWGETLESGYGLGNIVVCSIDIVIFLEATQHLSLVVEHGAASTRGELIHLSERYKASSRHAGERALSLHGSLRALKARDHGMAAKCNSEWFGRRLAKAVPRWC